MHLVNAQLSEWVLLQQIDHGFVPCTGVVAHTGFQRDILLYQLNHRKRTVLVGESDLSRVAAPDDPAKEYEAQQERFALYRAMQKLDAETREVIHLRLAGDFSFRDIGEILGHSEVWARVRFYRGKEELVKIIGGDNHV